jgi:hypothetical protein
VDNVISCRPHVLRLSIYMIFELPWSLLCLLQGRGIIKIKVIRIFVTFFSNVLVLAYAMIFPFEQSI